jgi:hypothetical protein
LLGGDCLRNRSLSEAGRGICAEFGRLNPRFATVQADWEESCRVHQPNVVLPTSGLVRNAAAELRTPYCENSRSEEEMNMRSEVAKLVIGIAITAIGVFGADILLA